MAGNGEVGVEQSACLLFVVVSRYSRSFFIPWLGLQGFGGVPRH